MEIQDKIAAQVEASTEAQVQQTDDLLWRHLKTVPAFRALLRAVEARFYQSIDLPEPLLDLGCGDGHFAQMALAKPVTVGIDPWWGPLRQAHQSGAYQFLVQSMGHQLPLPDNCFATVISNSVLEHIPDVQAVLNETNRVIQPGGKLITTMPSHFFTEYLGGADILQRIGFDSLAGSYRRFFNFISRHAHTDPPEVWAARLAQAGFGVERWQYYFSKEALRALEWGHVQGLPSAVLHFLTDHWIVAPWEDNLKRTERWVRPFYEEEAPAEGAYIFFVARKQASSPIQMSLPPANPFTIEELAKKGMGEWREEIEPEWMGGSSEAEPAERAETEPAPALAESPLAPISNLRFSSRIGPNLISSVLVFLSLICAIIGQSALNNNPSQPAAGLRWYGYSLLALLLLVWRQYNDAMPPFHSGSYPRLKDIPRQGWLYIFSLLLAFMAHRFVNDPFRPQYPGLALFTWLVAIMIAFYALFEQRPTGATIRHALRSTFLTSRFSLFVMIALFLIAFVLRAVALTRHPFILNGIEASIGLDALSVANGSLRSPFATGWLTNPTLPLYLLAIPLRFLGQSVLSIRLLSSLIGALTVPATYWIGERLWNREVGLVAAILLAGSHFHLHYSRLGMTNIWDPLLVLLALGLIGLAWQRDEPAEENRPLWLITGLVVGLNVYLFTASHLLPLILIVLFALVFFFDRERLRQQGRHLLAASALAIVVALPQLLYYNSNSGVFMERVNSLGILDEQSGWLSQEAARTDSSRGQVFRQQFSRAALAFNGSLDNSPAYRPAVSLLSMGTAVFFVLGLAIAVLRLRHLSYGLLLSWVAVTIIFAGALLIEPPNSHRLIIAAPAIMLLAAIALSEFGRLLAAGASRSQGAEGPPDSASSLRSPILLPALLIVATFFTVGDIIFYFGRYQNEHTFADRNTEIAHEMADYLNSLDGQWTAYFYGPPSMYISFPTIPFLASDFQGGINLFDVNEPNAVLPSAPTPSLAFIFLPERVNELATIQALHPNGQERALAGFHADPLFYVYEVERPQ